VISITRSGWNRDRVEAAAAELAFGSIAEETSLRRLYDGPRIRRLRRDLRSPATMPTLCSRCTFKIPAAERPSRDK
jgi:hypothetical protein